MLSKWIDEWLGRLVRGVLRLVLFSLLLSSIGAFSEGDELPRADKPPDIQAKAAVLMDRRSGRVLYAKNEHEMLPIASITKVMTALIALQNSTLEEIVTASERASGTRGTSIYLGIDEALPMGQMLEALMLRSANDGAVAIAEHIDGSVEAFAERMNRYAEELGAEAHFVNPHGLDEPGHRASALGMAKITCAALENEEFRRLVTTQRAVIPWRDSEYDRVLVNKNRLLTSYEGCTGIKTGFTSGAGRCLIFSAERDGMELVGVVLNCGNWFDAAAQLMDWGFATHKPTNFARGGTVIAEIPVLSGTRQSVELMARESIDAPISDLDEAILFLDVPEQLAAPIEAGAFVGYAWVEVDGQPLNKVELVAYEAVGEWGYLSSFRRVAWAWAFRLT